MTRIAKPKRAPSETADAYHERIAGWETMTRAATEIKTVRSRAADALRTIDDVQNRRGGPWYFREIPHSQKPRVAEWRQALADALAILDAIDADAWKPEVIEEATPAT